VESTSKHIYNISDLKTSMSDVAIWCPNGIPAGTSDHVDSRMGRRGSGSSLIVKFGDREADWLTRAVGLAGDGREQHSVGRRRESGEDELEVDGGSQLPFIAVKWRGGEGSQGGDSAPPPKALKALMDTE
jgi:hypothetical protein